MIRQSDFDVFFDPEGGKTYEVEAQRSPSGWDVEIDELHLRFSVPSEPEVFSRSISLIAEKLRRPAYRVSVTVALNQ